MEALEIGLLHKSFVSQSKALLFFLSLLLLMLASLHLETIWYACNGLFEAPAFAFLLLNCLIVTIIASTKLESNQKVGHEERESMREMEKGDEKGAFIAKNVIRRGVIGQSHNINSSILYDYYMNEGEDFVGSSCSLINANYEEEIKPTNVSEKKPIMRAYRLACTGSDIGNLKEKKLMRGSFSFNDRRGSPAKAALKISQKPNDNNQGPAGRAGNITDHQSRQPAEPAVAAVTHHPSLQEVWAAIMLAKKNDDLMPNHMLHAADPSITVSNYGNDHQTLSAAAAARTPPAATTDAPAAAAAAAHPPRGVTAAPNLPGAPPAAADDHELEELNRRAEEFIARFNHQMRLQHQESLQRKGRAHRPCNHHIQYSNHLQLPAPGLLVG